jgi:hypothetical protein
MLWGYVYVYILITIPPLLSRRILGTPWQPTTVLGDGDGQCFRLILHGYSTTSILIIFHVFDNHHRLWMCLWMYLWKCPYHAITSLLPTWHLVWFHGTSWTLLQSHRCYAVVLLTPLNHSYWLPVQYQIDGSCLTTLRCCGCAYGCILPMLLHLLLDKR